MIAFNKYYNKFNILSVSLVIVSLLLLTFKGLNFGIDFKGGTLIELRSTDSKINVSSLRDNLSQMNLGDVSVKNFGNETDFLIKFENNENKNIIEGLDMDSPVRMLDQSRIGEILCGESAALRGGGPVRAMLIQNTNPAVVAPETNKVLKGLKRDDLFLVVHEQFMTETANLADVVLPATMFLEHDDVYQGGGHQHIILGPKIIDPPEGCRSNHEVICELAQRLGAEHRGFNMTAREIIDQTLQDSGWGTLEQLEGVHWIDCQPDFDESHFLNGFAHKDKKFHF